jgi:alpha-2-macroglobulin
LCNQSYYGIITQPELYFMQQFIFIFFLLASFTDASAQVDYRKLRKESWQVIIYKIPADTAEKYYTGKPPSPDDYLNKKPFSVVHKDSLDHEQLPTGHYLLFAVLDNEITVSYYCRTNLLVMPINNQHRVQLELRGRNGVYYDDATVWVNKKKASYNKQSKTWFVKNKFPDEAVIKAAVASDTLLAELLTKGGWHEPILKQRWRKFRSTKGGYILTWPYYRVRRMIKQPPSNWFTKRRHIVPERGYVLLNKPLYKPGDTLKMKAFLFNRYKKLYKQKLDLYFTYYYNGKQEKKLVQLHQLTHGAFVHELVLGDTLINDISYSLELRNKKGQSVLRKNFRIEDYVPDEITNYNLRSEKELYFTGDTLRFFTSAKDANGLAVMDGKVTLTILTASVSNWYSNMLFIADTLWKQEQKLSVADDTKFELPSTLLPNADMELKVIALFQNSNNEIQQKELNVTWKKESRVIEVDQSADSIFARYLINGISTEANGLLTKSFEDNARHIRFPFSEKADTYTEFYDFEIKNSKDSVLASEYFEPEENYTLSFSRIQQGDTAGFNLYNPYKIAVHYTLFFGNRIITTAASNEEWISWKDKLPKGKMYRLEWQYIWNGEERKGNGDIVLLDKVAALQINGTSTVYPGMKDSITITATDYKNRPVKNMNLTVMSYNSQLSKKINVPEPPFLHRFKSPRRIVRENFELELAEFTNKFPLGKYTGWKQKFGLDTMLYYQFLFPEKGMRIEKKLVDDVVPQLSVFAVADGMPQEIHALYINNQLAYYNGVTETSAYSFAVIPAYAKLGIRLKDKYIEIDSMYMQLHYKHDVFIDVTNLPSKAKVEERPAYWTPIERLTLENSIWQLANDYHTNNAYVWQNEKLFFIGSNRKHIVGPFSRYSDLQYFKPGSFDSRFEFEPGYEYSIKKGMVRLEKTPLFPAHIQQPFLKRVEKTVWRMGDTLATAPKIEYKMPSTTPPPMFYTSSGHNYYQHKKGYGSLLLQYKTDSSFQYVLLFKKSEPWKKIIHGYNNKQFTALEPGVYDLVLITAENNLLHYTSIEIKTDSTTCYHLSPSIFMAYDTYWHNLLNTTEPLKITAEETKEKQQTVIAPLVNVLPGPGSVSGTVTDAKGSSPIPAASVVIKGTNKGTTTDRDGKFVINNLASGNYTLVIASVGYVTQERKMHLSATEKEVIMVKMTLSESRLDEVVVVGYGTKLKKEMTGSVAVVRSQDITTALQGKAPGVMVTGNSGSDTEVRIRGMSSISGNTQPLYVVNGVMMDELPAGLDTNTASISVLKDAAAINLYGARAVNGVVIITTKGFAPPQQLRQQFRDYAFWIPNLITNSKGIAKFQVTYPDNITSWQTFAVGMDKKRRIAKTSVTVKSFKPLLAQLSAPQFLVEGDSTFFIGKKTNYSSGDYSVNEQFSIGKATIIQKQSVLISNTADTSELPVAASNTDTLESKFSIIASNGFSDGELRKIPVFKRGTMETAGTFVAIDTDTSFSFTALPNASTLTLHAQNNTLDVLLDELEHLKKYPYYCMEQTASKLKGLVLEKKIRELLKQPFTSDKEIEKLKTKLQKAQLFDGGWAWWETGTGNLDITNFITRVLLTMRGDELLETAIRNALLYLQNQLPHLKRPQLLSTLVTLSEAGNSMNFETWLSRLKFDSLSMHEQWQYVSILQQQKMNYEKQLHSILEKKKQTMLGGLYWGEDVFWWTSNISATTVEAYKVLEKDGKYDKELKQIIQYFLETRKNGRWVNTVESASITSAILPRLTASSTNPLSPASIHISGDTSFVMNQLPSTVTASPFVKNLSISKTGGGLVYFTAHQTIFNQQPQALRKNFIINTWFERNGEKVSFLTAGEKVMLVVEINATTDAEYVQLEVPIPAGCTYGFKKQDFGTHKEYFKNKTLIFAEKMNAGIHRFTIELEPRYTGSYHLNPAKAELMYFPTFFGRDEMKKIEIKK